MIFGFIHKKNEYRFPFGAFHAALCLCFIANLLLGNVSTFGYSLPFHEAFDTSSVWNSQTVRGSDWQQGQPNYGQTNSTHSGSSCWDVSLNTAYRDSSLSYLISPSIDFNGEYNAQLSFWQNCNTEDLFDGARLDYSMNGGGWITLGMSGDPNGSNWYTRNNIASSNKPAWCGNSNGWINSSYTLVPLNGFTGTVRFRFVFTSNDSTQADGFSIDDFFIEPAPALDAGIESVIFPLPFAMENNFDSIQVLVKNYGAGPINSMSISYSLDGGVPISQTWNGNLLPAETDTFRFSTLWFVQSGFNSMCVFTALAGDANSWNDSVCKSIEGISVNTIPFADDFEVNNNQFHDSSYSGTHWEYGSPAFGSTSSSYSGSKCWDLNLNSAYSNHATSYLYSSFYDFTGVMNAKLSFWQNRNTERGFDGMCMEYSTDAGCTWSLLGSTSEENSLNWYNDSSISALGNYAGWDGNSGGWIQSSCILAALNSAGARVQFRFRFQSDGSTTSDGVSIDDFRIQPAPTTDLSLNAVRSPVGNKPENTVDTIRIRVRNLGMTDIHQFTLSYGVSGEIPRTLNWNGTLQPAEAIDVVVDTFLYRISDFDLNFHIQTLNDLDHSNDSCTIHLFGVPLIVPPFANSQENIQNFYTASGNSGWEWGRPNSSIINSAFDGSNCWKTNLNGDYSNRMNAYLYSPLFDFSNAYHPVLKFNHWINAESGMDGGRVEYSTDGGINWSVLGTSADPSGNNWYTNASIFSSNKPAWSGTTFGYVESSYHLDALSAYSGGRVQFRFNFSSNDSVTANGWAIDGFRIESRPAWSASPSIALDIQDPFTANATTQSLGCFIVNSGEMPFQDFKVSLIVDGLVICRDSVHLPFNLNSGDSIFHTFSSVWTPLPGAHEVCTQTDSPGNIPDQFTSDDMQCTPAGVLDTLPDLDVNPWCDDFDSSLPVWLTIDPQSNRFQSDQWTLGNPSQNFLQGVYNGTAAWVTGSLMSYQPATSTALISPVMKADSGACYELSFYHRYKTEMFEDGGTVEYTIDNGSSWKIVGYSGEPGWFNSSYISGLKLPPVPGWSGSSNGWELARHEIYFPSAANAVFRFRFGSDASVQDEGWEIDQVCFKKLSTCVIGLEEIESSSVSVFPNPVQSKCVVQIDHPFSKISSVFLENILGKKINVPILNTGDSDFELNMQQCSPGLYFVRVRLNKGELIKKVIKE